MIAPELRARSLELLHAGELTPAHLVDLSRRRVELLYDLVELQYGADDIDAVDAVRAMAMEAAQLIVLGDDTDGGAA